MGRLKSRLTKIIFSRISEQESEVLTEVADLLRRTKSDVIRQALLEYFKKYENQNIKNLNEDNKVGGRSDSREDIRLSTTFVLDGDIAKEFTDRFLNRYNLSFLALVRDIMEKVLELDGVFNIYYDLIKIGRLDLASKFLDDINKAGKKILERYRKRLEKKGDVLDI